MARGRGGLSFNVEQLGFSRGELPATVLTPPPLFPPLINRPLPIAIDERINDFIRCKKELRHLFGESEYHVKPRQMKKSVEKYSDRHVIGGGNAVTKMDWNRCPKELRMIRKDRRKIGDSKLTKLKNIDVEGKLKALEQKENADIENEEEEEEEKKTNDDDDDDQEADEEEYDEEEQEEGTDYVSSYFDNGENYLDEDDDNLDDGPIY